jgi:alkyldihydroxyacetonephosphate synthase
MSVTGMDRCISDSVPGAMRWYGWGTEALAFDPADRPGLWPYAAAQLGISASQPRWQPVDPTEIRLPPPRRNPDFIGWLRTAFSSAAWSERDDDRLRHATGRSTSDIWHLRLGRIIAAPDCVVFPDSEADVLALIAAAQRFGVVLIPFGGGSNVAGCLAPSDRLDRMTVSVDLRRMSSVLDIDAESGLVRVEAGILGPALEAALESARLTLGHFPDSFLFSTLGGWVSTRSSGMLSDGYGNIEDMVAGLRIATPAGVLETRPIPHASNGPDVKRFVIGSEGTLGIITVLTMRVRPRPQRREFRGYLFPNFEAGLDAVREAAREGVSPVMTRLNDPAKTQLSAAFRRRRTGAFAARLERVARRMLATVKRMDLSQAALMIGGFEGDSTQIRAQRAAAERVWRRCGAIALGQKPGRAMEDSKFDLPYVRDFLMDYNVIVDVAETCLRWKDMRSSYHLLTARAREALTDGGRRAWLGCHVSHCYSSGASLYFTFAFRCRADTDGRIDRTAELGHYRRVKHVLLDGFSDCGGTVSHHHAVGLDHLPWLRAETAIGNVMPVAALKAAIDPDAVMNPGKLVLNEAR